MKAHSTPVIPEFFYRESTVRPRFPIKHFGNDGVFAHYNCQLEYEGCLKFNNIRKHR